MNKLNISQITVSPTHYSGYVPPDGASYVSQCQADGTWSSRDNFVCSPVDCGQPPHVANASHIDNSATTFGENVTAFCLPGFLPLTGFVFTCDETGSWVGSDVTCGQINCGNPSPVHSACRLDGTWSGSQLECEEWNCEPPPDLANGAVHYTSLRLNSTAVYTCDPGLRLLEASTVENISNALVLRSVDAVCNDERVWVSRSRQEPTETLTCVEVQCPSAPTIPNTRVVTASVGSIAVTDSVRYECLDGYKHRGLDPEIICQDNGTWSFPFFECLKIDCGHPPRIRFAEVSFDSGTTVGSEAAYTCDVGYDFVGNQTTRTCESDGLWSREFIQCIPEEQKNCGDPPKLFAMAKVEVHFFQNTWTAVYTCAEGYQHAWSNTLDCYPPLFYWIAAPVIRCDLADCGDPPPVENADAIDTKTTAGSVVTYQCRGDHVPSGDNDKTCTPQGSWSTEPVVECIRPGTVVCGPPPQVMNSKRMYTSTTEGSLASYRCDHGFTGPQFETLCGPDGQWTPIEPSACSRVACGTAPTVKNSAASYLSGTEFGDVVVYKCQEGHKLTGTSLKTCQADGLWSPDIVECVQESATVCGDPPRKDGTIVMYDSRAVGAIAVYSSVAHYTGDNLDSRCRPDGQWSKSNGAAYQIVNCDLPAAIPNSEIALTPENMPFGRSVVHSCNPGFMSTTGAPLVSTCMEDGTWSLPYGVCEAVDEVQNEICDRDLPFVPHGLPVFQDSTHVGATVYYVCDAGYFPLPSAANFAHTCLSDDRWSLRRPLICYPGLCLTTAPPLLDNAEYVGLSSPGTVMGGTDDLIGSYSCSTGHTTDKRRPALDGSNTFFTVACNPSVGWSDVAGSQTQGCAPVDCGQLQLGEEYKAASTNYSSAYMSQVEISCQSTPANSAENKLVVCNATGHWSFKDDALICAPCDEQEDVPNGRLEARVDSQSPQHADEASVQCDRDYILIGPDTVRCASINGTARWKDLNDSRCVQNVWRDVGVPSLS
ncbi:sushi, von Willebrand factor type A, EGF and pentraxin domain-containing protein 1 [Elysia marginata]|uniref:Sushi, von Willebrand factor type A, EGF and pentraxin domain-containing protein 1 n=1 Tax=Elysia marginata TaxID=1093978 RepID=A0AAV4GH22_9GAST|nr:sushi, von Willebrand factor type A, EGF and pentraxin domain-containing protein 1 [Elysia marginata]